MRLFSRQHTEQAVLCLLSSACFHITLHFEAPIFVFQKDSVFLVLKRGFLNAPPPNFFSMLGGFVMGVCAERMDYDQNMFYI